MEMMFCFTPGHPREWTVCPSTTVILNPLISQTFLFVVKSLSKSENVFFLFSNAAKNYAIYFVDAARCSASICLKTKVNRSWPLAISTVRIQLYVQSVTGVELKKELWLVGMIFEINTEGAGNGSCTNGTDIFKHENEIEKNITILVLNNHVLNTVTKMTSRDQLIKFSRNNKINSRAFVIFLII